MALQDQSPISNNNDIECQAFGLYETSKQFLKEETSFTAFYDVLNSVIDHTLSNDNFFSKAREIVKSDLNPSDIYNLCWGFEKDFKSKLLPLHIRFVDFYLENENFLQLIKSFYGKHSNLLEKIRFSKMLENLCSSNKTSPTLSKRDELILESLSQAMMGELADSGISHENQYHLSESLDSYEQTLKTGFGSNEKNRLEDEKTAYSNLFGIVASMVLLWVFWTAFKIEVTFLYYWVAGMISLLVYQFLLYFVIDINKPSREKVLGVYIGLKLCLAILLFLNPELPILYETESIQWIASGLCVSMALVFFFAKRKNYVSINIESVS